MPSKKHREQNAQRHSAFRLIVLVNTSIFAASLIALIILADVWTDPTTTQTQVVDLLIATVTASASTMLGLLVGKLAG
jgi:hypothetical protein